MSKMYTILVEIIVGKVKDLIINRVYYILVFYEFRFKSKKNLWLIDNHAL